MAMQLVEVIRYIFPPKVCEYLSGVLTGCSSKSSGGKANLFAARMELRELGHVVDPVIDGDPQIPCAPGFSASLSARPPWSRAAEARAAPRPGPPLTPRRRHGPVSPTNKPRMVHKRLRTRLVVRRELFKTDLARCNGHVVHDLDLLKGRRLLKDAGVFVSVPTLQPLQRSDCRPISR